MPTAKPAMNRHHDPPVVHDLGLDPAWPGRRPACRRSPAMTPRRAVFGSLIQYNAKMNSAAASDGGEFGGSGSASYLALLEHLQHPVGDHEPAHDVRHRGEQGDGAHARGCVSGYSAPATTIEPTTAIAEIALVSDISGVCSSRETRRITPNPMKSRARTRTASTSSRPSRDRPLAAWAASNPLGHVFTTSPA